MGKTERTNQTALTEFILLGFGDFPKGQEILLFLAFLIIYLVALAGNLIVMLIVADRHLHTPMYYFLGNLSFLEICYGSSVLPRMLVSFSTGMKTIPFGGCFVKYYMFACLAGTECYLLSVV